jgi:hypothetical protein
MDTITEDEHRTTIFVDDWSVSNSTEMIVDVILSTLAPNTTRARRRGGPFRYVNYFLYYWLYSTRILPASIQMGILIPNSSVHYSDLIYDVNYKKIVSFLD